MKYSQLMIAAAVAALWGGAAQAAVSADEAKALGTTLTPLGAEKAANKDGSIPAYTGASVTPAGFKAGSAVRPDPFASEKPKFSVTPANAAQYSDKLTAGAKELLKKFPDFRMDVFPTHRSYVVPQSVIDGTLKNATNAKTKDGGVGIEGAHGGIPFPIPKNGIEVMWNHMLRYQMLAYTSSIESFNVDASGNVVQSNGAKNWADFPYYASTADGSGNYYRLKTLNYAPTRRVGEALIIIDNINPLDKGRRAWQYLPGQRRVKVAPDIAYDTPTPNTAGASNYDDTFMYSGAMDRFDYKLVGKKEMIVPYNTYKFTFEPDIAKNLAGKQFANPDFFRWELHRVWVVEATLKPGARHSYAKRTFYVDEDSWMVLATDSYDARGQLYRAAFDAFTPLYDVKGMYTDGTVYYDFVAGIYSIAGLPVKGPFVATELFGEKTWSPDSLSGTGVR